MSTLRLRQRARGTLRRNPMPTATMLATPKDFPAPLAGWITNENIALANPLGALVLENFFPTERSIQARGGSRLWATLDSSALYNDRNPVYSLINYKAGESESLFASCGGNIYNVTSVAPTIVPTPVVTGQTSDHYSGVLMTNDFGSFLGVYNGSDNPQVWNGTVWEELEPADYTGDLTDPQFVSQAFKHRSRIFLIQGGLMDAFYLEVNAYKGESTVLPLGGIFKHGGGLLFGATWSQDAGDGADDRCVFVTDIGEAAVFSGGDPATWSLIGRYDLGSRPRGKNAWLAVAGDLLIITDEGVIPISQVVGRPPESLALVSLAKNIRPDWKRAASDRGGWPWEATKYGAQGMGVISWPRDGEEMPPMTPVVNLNTGAWAKFTGWDVLSVAIHIDRLHFGTTDGRVFLADVSAEDEGALYEAKAVWAFSDLDNPGVEKLVHKARVVYRSGYPFIPQVSASTDYTVTLPASPEATTVQAGTVGWDGGLWDVALWDAEVIPSTSGIVSDWDTIGRIGFSHAMQVQITFDGTQKPDVEVLRVTATYSTGGVVTSGR